MPLRHARHTDIPQMAAVYAAAFHDEDIVGKVLNPYRVQYPADYLRWWQQRVTESLWDYGHQMVVTYTIQDGKEVVTGVGDWVRKGEDWWKHWGLWGRWDPRKFYQYSWR